MCDVMLRSCLRVLPFGFTCGALFAQAPATAPPPGPAKVEPGLEEAVNWKWNVTAAAKPGWGLPLPEELQPKTPAAPATSPGVPAPAPAAEERPTSYAVQKGDAIIKIARRFHMTPEQLKQFNELKDDRIVIGQILKIPTPAEILQMPPPPPPPEAKKAVPKAEAVEEKEGEGDKPKETPPPEPQTYEQLVLETVLLQVFLDREMFSPGAIDGKSGPTFDKVTQIYQLAHPELADPAKLRAKAIAEVKQPYTSYVLRAEDFRFIQPRQAAKPAPGAKRAPAKKKGPATAPPVPPLSYQEMVAADFLGYASVWEFVAERFHCDEGFLRERNPKIKDNPSVGAVFEVPNVVPFEIEKALEAPLQAAADPQKPVTAAVVNLTRLEISREGHLIAVLPLASARPGLRGRGSWTVMDAVPQPRLATTREPREAPKAPATPTGGNPSAPAPAPSPAATAEQFLAPGPNNPVGILWINLAKANSTEALPYGLHGTSIPARMRSQEGIGGFRLANWDIARAVRLMPAGTALQWKAE